MTYPMPHQPRVTLTSSNFYLLIPKVYVTLIRLVEPYKKDRHGIDILIFVSGKVPDKSDVLYTPLTP